MTTKKKMDHLVLRIIITSCALILAFIYLVFPKIKIDSIGLGLIILATVPWLAPIIKKIELTGVGMVELQDLKDEIVAVKTQIKQDRRLQEALRDAIFYRMQKKYAESEAAYKRALSIDPDSEEAEVGLAVAKSYISPKNFDESIKILSNVIKKHPYPAKAYYDRACIRALKKDRASKQIWLEDLKEAIRLDEKYRQYAKTDEDFKKYWKDKAFLEIVNAK